MKQLQPKSLFARFFLSFFFTLIATMLCIVLITPYQLEQMLIASAERDMVMKSDRILPSAANYLAGRYTHLEMVSLVATLEDLLGARMYIADRNGMIRITGEGNNFMQNTYISAEDLATLQSNEQIRRRETLARAGGAPPQQILLIASPVKMTVSSSIGVETHYLGSLYLQVPMATLNTTAGIARRQVGYVPIIATCFALLMAGYISHSMSQPLKDLSVAALLMANGDYSTRFTYESDDELGQLSASFNHLASSMEQSIGSLREQQKRTENLINALTEGVMAIDAEQRIILFNPAAAEFLHLQSDEVLGKVFTNICLPELLSQRFAEMDTVPYSELLPIDDRHMMSLTISPVLDEANHLSAQIAVLKDITEAHRLEEQRKEFVANVSHELRTPLTSIQGFVEGLLDHTIPPEHSERYLGIIHQESIRITRMIHELLNLSHIESGHMLLKQEAVELGPLLSSLLLQSRTAFQREDIQFHVNLMPPEPVLYADPDRLEQILLNLLTNAIKFTPQDGDIFIRSFALVDNPGKICIEILDSGNGIAEGDIPYIWDRFFKSDRSRSSRGTGLGLAIVRSLIDAHQESIWVKNLPPLGACFSLTMPLISEEEDNTTL